ncbi:MAG: SCO family protein [Nitrospinae bacterium]|nr:SCO family protein [Nitrospinota bacterium]
MTAVAAGASAQNGFRPPDSELDPEVLRVDESVYLGVKPARETALVLDDGREVTLGDFRGKPLILVLSYFTCDGFCPAFNADLQKVLEKVEALKNVKIGDDFTVLTVSFDKNDTKDSSAMFHRSMGMSGKIGDNWRMATFKDPADLAKITSGLGFKFFWSPADRMFFHPGVYYFMSPEGRVVRILQHSVAEPRDMELAIIESKFNKLAPSEAGNMVMSMCYSYNFKEGKYGLNYPLFISFGSLVTGVTAFLFAANFQRKKAKRGKES